jgi:hypothetical protein
MVRPASTQIAGIASAFVDVGERYPLAEHGYPAKAKNGALGLQADWNSREWGDSRFLKIGA